MRNAPRERYPKCLPRRARGNRPGRTTFDHAVVLRRRIPRHGGFARTTLGEWRRAVEVQRRHQLAERLAAMLCCLLEHRLRVVAEAVVLAIKREVVGELRL